MKATAFAPAHISGFFEPVYHPQDFNKSGSRGAGINLSIGSTSSVFIENSTSQIIQIFINGKKSNAPVTNLALRILIGNQALKIVVKIRNDLPLGQGFGMSASGTLSSTLAATKILGLPQSDALYASHCSEVKLRTGLGDVIASNFGGIEIRKSAGLPPWGIIEHIPGRPELVLCVIGKKINTKKILTNPVLTNKIVEYGKFCTKKILEKPSIENLFYLSQYFTKKTGLANKDIINAINKISNYGSASMCMLGNSIFAMGKTDIMYNILSKLGKTCICTVDTIGARIIDS